MDNSLSESARFAVYREKLKGICEANNLSYVFIKNAYPIKLVIRPLGGVGEQMSMLEEASEDNYISPGASILFTVKDGNLTYRMSKTFTISDTLFNKIKNIFKNMHYLWLQFFFRDLVEGGKLAALGYKMPDIPESGGQQDAPRENEPDSSNLPGEAEPLEEVDAEELDDAEEPALGYEMADDEKALQDGTHQLFAVYGSGSKADTPCDKCKAAHPECDKCCKTCDDHCNAFQLCRKEYGE